MNPRLRSTLAALTLTAGVAGCTGGSSNDISPSSPPVSQPVSSDMFLVFPNPQVPPDTPDLAHAQTLSQDYALAYYEAIDPLNEKDTLDKWKAANGFGSGTGIEVSAVFGDIRDLGYGRKMTARRDPARKTIAFLVENYLVSPGGVYGYTPESLDAALASDTRWRIQYNAIEYSLGPNAQPGDVPFAKFYNFDPVSGQRRLTVDIDGRGQKAMPAVCFSCHGGRADALERNASGKLFFGHPLFASANGDAQARLQPFEVGNFDFSKVTGHTRADYEAALKLMNRFVLCSYPVPAGGPNNCPDEPVFNHPAKIEEWQGGAANLIRNAYGGDNLPNDTYVDTYIPSSWANGNPNVYRSVIAKSCRACHMLRDNGRDGDSSGFPPNPPHVDFDNYQQFVDKYAKLTRHYLFDLGNMPLAKIVYDNFWQSDGPQLLAQFLEPLTGSIARDASGKPVQPGRPVADPGPLTRTVLPGWVPLRAVQTFNDAYSWSVIQAPAGVAPQSVPIQDADKPQARFNATVGIYTVQLVASRAGVQSAPQTVTVVVKDSIPGLLDQNTIGLANIKAIMADNCISCHSASQLAPNSPEPLPPVDFADDVGLYERIRSRINFTDIATSRLLLKPADLVAHGGGLIFDASLPPGDQSRANYDNFINWIANGAPQ